MLGYFKRREKKLSRELLTSYGELAGLAPAQLDYIVNHQRIIRHRKGSSLFRRSDVANRVFLFSGTACLALRDGGTRRVDAARQAFPPSLNRGAEQVDSAFSETVAETFEVPAKLLCHLESKDSHTPDQHCGMVVEELSGDETGRIESRLAYRIYNDSIHDRLSLPTLPELAVSLGQAVSKSGCTTRQVARIIQSDVSITARLVQIANGPLYRGSQAIQTCHEAVTRLGLHTTRDIVRGLSLRQIFRTDNPRLAERLRELWHHSTRVAAVSAVIARMVPGLDAERAMLAGLMHDVGVLVILKYVNDMDTDDYCELELEEAIGRLRGEIGAAVLRKWNFDDDLIHVALEAENYKRDAAGSPDYCDIVSVAQIHCFFGTPQIRDCPPLLEVPAFSKLPLRESGPEMSIESLRDAQADIDEVLAMLQF